MQRAAFLTWLSAALLVGCNKPSSQPAVVRNDQVIWYIHRATPLNSFRSRSTFVTFSISGPTPPREQLLDGLENPKTYVAAHLLLLNGAPTAGPPGTFESNTEHRAMAAQLSEKYSVTLQDRPDGSCLATIDGLRVVLRRSEEKGSYFGHGRVGHTIYAATAEVDDSQQVAIRERWRR